MRSDLENFHATTSHRRPGRILFHAGFTPDLERRVKEHIKSDDIAGHYGYFAPAWITVNKPENVPDLDYSRYWKDEKLPEGTTFSGGLAMVPSGFYHFWGFISPLRNAASLADIEGYPMHDASSWDASSLPGKVAEAHAAGKAAQGWIGHMYESAWQIRGYEQFLIDTIERPSWAECLLERIARQNMIGAVAYAKAGVDYVTCGDDVANQKALMFAPPVWRKLMLSRWSKIWAAIRSINPACRIWYHSDGNITDIIPELLDAGVDILNPLQPECLDLDAIHRTYGRRMVIDGAIGTQSTMPFGTPADVRVRVKEIIGKYGRDGGLIVSPTHVLEPEVPLANIDALSEACREFGTFE